MVYDLERIFRLLGFLDRTIHNVLFAVAIPEKKLDS